MCSECNNDDQAHYAFRILAPVLSFPLRQSIHKEITVNSRGVMLPHDLEDLHTSFPQAYNSGKVYPFSGHLGDQSDFISPP